MYEWINKLSQNFYGEHDNLSRQCCDNKARRPVSQQRDLCICLEDEPQQHVRRVFSAHRIIVSHTDLFKSFLSVQDTIDMYQYETFSHGAHGQAKKRPSVQDFKCLIKRPSRVALLCKNQCSLHVLHTNLQVNGHCATLRRQCAMKYRRWDVASLLWVHSALKDHNAGRALRCLFRDPTRVASSVKQA